MIRQITNCDTQSVCPKPYPKIMKHKITGSIFLFESPNRGVRLVAGVGATGVAGSCGFIFIPTNFEDYNESVTIVNC